MKEHTEVPDSVKDSVLVHKRNWSPDTGNRWGALQAACRALLRQLAARAEGAFSWRVFKRLYRAFEIHAEVAGETDLLQRVKPLVTAADDLENKLAQPRMYRHQLLAARADQVVCTEGVYQASNDLHAEVWFRFTAQSDTLIGDFEAWLRRERVESAVEIAWLEKQQARLCRDLGEYLTAWSLPNKPSAACEGAEAPASALSSQSRADQYKWARQAELLRASAQVLGPGLLHKGVLSRACTSGQVVTNGQMGHGLRVQVSSFLVWMTGRFQLAHEEKIQVRNAIIGEVDARKVPQPRRKFSG